MVFHYMITTAEEAEAFRHFYVFKAKELGKRRVGFESSDFFFKYFRERQGVGKRGRGLWVIQPPKSKSEAEIIY